MGSLRGSKVALQHRQAIATPSSARTCRCSALIDQEVLSRILNILEEEVHVIQFIEEPIGALKVEQAAVCLPLQDASPQERGAIGCKFQSGTGNPSHSNRPLHTRTSDSDQEVTILELLTDRRQQPFLIPISREDHIVASVSICRVEPRSEAAIGKMHAHRLDIENELKAVIGEAVCKFDILGAAKVFVEAADSQNVAPSKRSISGIELPRRCRPVSSQQEPCTAS